MAVRASPTLTISIENGNLVLKNESTFRSRTSELPLDGSEAEEGESPQGLNKVTRYCCHYISYSGTANILVARIVVFDLSAPVRLFNGMHFTCV